MHPAFPFPSIVFKNPVALIYHLFHIYFCLKYNLLLMMYFSSYCVFSYSQIISSVYTRRDRNTITTQKDNYILKTTNEKGDWRVKKTNTHDSTMRNNKNRLEGWQHKTKETPYIHRIFKDRNTKSTKRGLHIHDRCKLTITGTRFMIISNWIDI
jgi:hypothetical protein